MSGPAGSVEQYLANLPEDRRAALSAVRESILQNLPVGYEESILWGMITYSVPLSRYPKTYNGQPLMYAALASQKNYMSVYLNSVYGDAETEAWFRSEYEKRGKKPDMGKSCVRFKRLADLPVDLIGQAVARVSVDEYLERYEQSRKGS